MLYKNNIIRFMNLGVLALSLSMTGCAAKKSAWGDLQTGLILQYNIQQDQKLNYRRNSEAVQNMEMMGQAMKITTKTETGYTIKGAGTDDQSNIKTEIIINELAINASSPQGPINPDTSGLKGKSFEAIYSTKGKEVEVSGIDALPGISMGQPAAQPQSVKNYFSNLLIQLPEDNLKLGDTWKTPIDTTREQGALKLTIKGETTSVLDGLENLQGMDCVKIVSRSESSVEGSGDAMGNEIKINGDIKSTSTSYFAYKKGIFVKSAVEQNSTMKIDLGAMGEMPQSAEEKTTIELVK